MRQVYTTLGTCVLFLTFTGLLPAIPPDESVSPGDEFSRKAIMVRPPSLLEMMGGEERDLLSLFQHRASAPGAVMENQLAGSLMVSLHGARPPISPGENLQETAVHRAILRGRPDVLGRLLSEESSPDEIHSSGWNTLQLALQRRDQQALKILLSHGADPRKKGVGALTSLGLALVLESSPAELELLLNAGADPNHIGSGGHPVLHTFLRARDLERAGVFLRHGAEAGPALYNAVVEGDRGLFRFLLEQGCKPERDSKDPVLVAAVREGESGVVGDLLASGVLQARDLGRRGSEGQSALHLAVAMNRLDLCRVLLEGGADPNVPFARPASAEFLARVRPVGFLKSHLKHDSRVTPLMAAADCGNLELAKLLMDHGARRFIWTRRKSYYPIGFAARRGDVKMMQLLLGVDPGQEERWVKVDLSEQRAWVYDGEGKELLTTSVSTGKKGFQTEPGEFVITNRNRHHVSNIYGVRMPYFQRLNCSAIGFHEGYCPGYPASHGCLRVPRGQASELWDTTKLGDRVVIVP